ncbi:Phosphatidylinositol 4,5-bisphosphate 5-phosphatase A [Hypsibius exemplaris]|uniref:Phosphatidylinositol 4,5-bisphosphate 5-phosphatase A n=1 Tax=Hypsibius exemplaris TaxID=2072580 RepID=A0A1W0WMT2_HYPEX|nr:Phosphatidylinositol 4,5-bisphosphate 5-phosphatase A [Hypsibius exemplaris]
MLSVTDLMPTSTNSADSSPTADTGMSRGHYRRMSSFNREFPDIPVLQFDSKGDKLDPDKPKLRIRTLTWNIAGHQPKEDLTDVLGLAPERESTPDGSASSSADIVNEGKPEADLIAIGFQELSASPAAPVMESVIMSEIWTTTLKKRMSSQDYVLLQSIRLQGIVLFVFSKSRHLKYVRYMDTAYLRLGASGWWGNKGAVGISFEIYDVTLCFVNSHLSPHDHAFKDRVKNHRQILRDMVFVGGRTDTSCILEHDYAVWLGDFNFRIEGISQDKTLHYIESQKWPQLLKHDQLHRAAFVEGAFSTFQEGKIEFPPTYKFVTGTSIYDTRNPAKIRRPSYCDRILWRTRTDARKAALIEYTSHMNHQISDHKPVTAVLEIALGSEQEQYVVFDPIDRWFVGQHGYFRYSAKPGTFYSAWDWIGLYKASYTSFDEYVTYVWSPGASEENLGCINGRYVLKPGRYLLVYFSSEHKCGIGFSEIFEIVSA